MIKRLWYTNSISLINEIEKSSDDFDATLILCKSPGVADKVRLRFQNNKIQVHTIQSGLKKILEKSLSVKTQDLSIMRKSDMLFELWAAWVKFGLEKSYPAFNNSFKLATELRGFTTSIDLIIDILSEHDEEMFKGANFLLNYMDARDIYDENSFYSSLATSSFTDLNNVRVIFLGFLHFSGNQIDMLKNLSNQMQVTIPIYKHAKENLSFSDWPSWLDDFSQDEAVDEKQIAENNTKKKVKVLKFASFNQSFIIQEQVERAKEKKIDLGLYYWNQQDYEKQINQINLRNFQFKNSINLFAEEAKLIEENLEKICPCSVKTAAIELQEQLKFEINTGKNYRKIKLLNMILDILRSFEVFSYEELTYDDLKIIFEKITLDLPRNSLINLSENDLNFRAGTLDLAPYDLIGNQVFIITKDLNFEVSEHIDEELAAKLSTLGPLRNMELDQLFNLAILEDSSENNQVTICIDQSLIDKTDLFNSFFLNEDNAHEKFWDGEIYQGRELSVGSLEQSTDFSAVKVSPSRLQSFIDCPYKYYNSYLEDYDEKRSVSSDIFNWELGTYAHDILAEIMPDILIANKVVDVEEVKQRAISHLSAKSYIFNYRKEFIEKKIIDLVSEGVRYFQEFPRDVIMDVLPEYLVKDQRFQGRIDLLLKLKDNEYALIDYKKSAASIPSRKAFLEGSTIQLSLYSMLIKELNVSFLGYFCLEDPKSSLFFYREESSNIRKVMNSNFFEIINEKNLFSMDTETSIHKKINEHYEALCESKEFIAKPKSSTTCLFCQYQPFCTSE